MMNLPPPPEHPFFHVMALARGAAAVEPEGEAPPTPPEVDEIEGPAWVDVAFHHKEARKALRSLGITDKLTIDALLIEETRPRAWAEGDALVGFFRGVNLNPNAKPEDMVSLRIWMTKDRIVTLHARRIMAIESAVSRLRVGKGAHSTSAMLVDLARSLTERLEEQIDGIDESIQATEEKMTEDPGGSHPRFAPVRRRVVMIRRYVTPQRDVLAQLASKEFEGWFSDREREALKELENRQARLVEDLDELRERAQVLIEEAQTAASERMARTNYVLTIVAALFLPLGFLTGLLGINVGGIPGSENGTAFWVFCGLLVLVVIGQIMFFRWRHWL